jgi:hypothetical protein
MTASDQIVPNTEPGLVGAGEGGSPLLDPGGFSGPVAFWDYLGSRLRVTGQRLIPPLARPGPLSRAPA